MAPPEAHIVPIVDSTRVFKPDIFKGKVLFCTGGGSGIGRVMTEAMMRHGADAVIVGRNLERLIKTSKELSEATGRTCIPAQADVREPEKLKDAVEKAIQKFSRIDFVICGAAGNFLAPISLLSENAFKTVVSIDTLGTFNTVKATLPHIRESRGSYIHITATFQRRGTPFQAHLSAAKAGIDALSHVLAVEEGPHGVRSNVIAPGPIADTPGMDRLSSPLLPEGFKGPSLPSCVGRDGHPKDCANAAVFLFSEAASYITGTILVVDGGTEHVRGALVPYPSGVLDPIGLLNQIKSKL